MANNADLIEHFSTVVIIFGFVWTALLGCLIYIFNSVKGEIREVKDQLVKLTDELFERLGKAERSMERLWGEHKATHNGSGRHE